MFPGDDEDEELEESEDEESEDDTGALAGKSLAQAIESGDGAAVFKAFKALSRECQETKSEKPGIGILLGLAGKKSKE